MSSCSNCKPIVEDGSRASGVENQKSKSPSLRLAALAEGRLCRKKGDGRGHADSRCTHPIFFCTFLQILSNEEVAWGRSAGFLAKS